jgi:hypothetical protein
MESIRFEKCIRHYNRYYRTRRKDELEFFASQPTVRLAIISAALARGSGGKKLKRQHRLTDSGLRKAKQALLAVERQITRCTTFDETAAVRGDWRSSEILSKCILNIAKVGTPPAKKSSEDGSPPMPPLSFKVSIQHHRLLVLPRDLNGRPLKSFRTLPPILLDYLDQSRNIRQVRMPCFLNEL